MRQEREYFCHALNIRRMRQINHQRGYYHEMPGANSPLHRSHHPITRQDEACQTYQHIQPRRKFKTKEADIKHQKIHQPNKE